MNPRLVKNFLTSRFGLFVVFVAVLFSGLWLYGQNQVEQKQTGRAVAAAKKSELGRMQAPLNQGLENGVPQKSGDLADATAGGKIVSFRPPAPPKAVAPPPAPARPSTEPRRVRYTSLLAAYTPTAAAQPVTAPPKRFMP